MSLFRRMSTPLRRTPLYDLHVARGASMVPFAGYEMPVQYPTGIIAEHLHTRAKAGLFDVSHMGQIALRGDARGASAGGTGSGRSCRALAPGRMRYTLLLNEAGGIIDDLMATRRPDGAGNGLMLVVNAARKEADLAHLRTAPRPRDRDRAALRARAAGVAGTGGGGGAGPAWRRGIERMPFMSAAESDRSPACRAS